MIEVIEGLWQSHSLETQEWSIGLIFLNFWVWIVIDTEGFKVIFWDY